MSSSIVIVIKSDETQAFHNQLHVLSSSKPKQQAQALSKLLKDISSGRHRAVVNVSTSAAAPVQASGTITCASVSADDTVTILGTVLTAKASPSGEDQWSQAGTNTEDAASLASKINAHSTLSKLVHATSSSGVVTVKAHEFGIAGNKLTLVSSNGTRLAVTGSGYLTNGAGGAQQTPTVYSNGL